MKPVHPLTREHAEVRGPERAVAKPRAVFDVADERAPDRPHRVERPLDQRRRALQCAQRIDRVLHAIGQFERGVHEPPGVVAGGHEHGSPLSFSR